MKVEQVIAIAKEVGFEIAEPLDPKTLVFRQEVRDMCSPEKCHTGYGKSWSCPPAAAPLGELTEKAKKYSKAIAVQTICHMEDEFDFESVMDTAKSHAEKFVKLADKLSELSDDTFPMGAGSCPRCESCTYPANPCRFPDKILTSMEASGLLVSQVCKDNNIPYYYGSNTVAYTSCCLF